MINDSGVYRSVCVEMDVFGLAVCAIMNSGQLDAEGLTSLTVSVADMTANSSGGKTAAAALSADSSSARAYRHYRPLS